MWNFIEKTREFARAITSPAPRSAAVDVAVPPLQKPRPANTVPTFVTSSAQRQDSFLVQKDLRLASTDLSLIRNNSTSSASLIRDMAKASPDLSAAIFAGLRMAVSGDYTVLARNLDGTLNLEGTKLIQQLCRRFDLMPALSIVGFNSYPSMRSISESLGWEFSTLGAGAFELVLDKSRAPEGLKPISIETIKFKFDGKRKVPYQVLGQDEISLDVPTFFYDSLDQDLRSAYADSPVQSALQPIQATLDFMNDLRRVFRRALHPRVTAEIDEEAWLARIPGDLKLPGKEAELKAYMDTVVAAVQTFLDNLNPDDAIVAFNTLKFGYLQAQSSDLSDEYKILSQILNGKISSGCKSTPVVLGHDATGSTNLGSTQSMLFVKTAEGAIQAKLNGLLSRGLTLALRMYGIDAVVEFKWDKPNLRPEVELEAFYAMRQSRYLELVSAGFMDMQEASILLTGTLTPVGTPDLTGTGFMNNKAKPDTSISTPESNTSALNQGLKSKSPTGVKSQ